MKKHAANIITLSRIFFIFVVVVLLYCKDCPFAYCEALILTAILMWFDGLDGFVARKFGISSRLGALLDIMGLLIRFVHLLLKKDTRHLEQLL